MVGISMTQSKLGGLSLPNNNQLESPFASLVKGILTHRNLPTIIVNTIKEEATLWGLADAKNTRVT